MRLFIGIPLDPALSAKLSAVRSALEHPSDGLRWSSPASWHITLQFLGATTDAQYACLTAHLQAISAPPFPVALDHLGFFDRAGVFFAEVQVNAELAHLQQAVTQATAGCGFVAEDRAYHPHVTLARRKGQSGNSMRELKRRVEADPTLGAYLPWFTAQEFLLYQSFPGPGGSRYEVRARYALHAV
ncbi:RNA 2',3'-cyclic phosphodiesterase [Acidobacteria bacterium AB60]|nr:RNA 2',3'-cyclic phosphodiesterase [Acidobacteria bacterium AB60]